MFKIPFGRKKSVLKNLSGYVFEKNKRKFITGNENLSLSSILISKLTVKVVEKYYKNILHKRLRIFYYL